LAGAPLIRASRLDFATQELFIPEMMQFTSMQGAKRADEQAVQRLEHTNKERANQHK